MPLPTIQLIRGYDKDVLIRGPGTSVVDFSTFVEVRLVCTGLEMEKSTDDPAEIEVQNDGADLMVHFLASDTEHRTLYSRAYGLFAPDGAGKVIPLEQNGFIAVMKEP